MENGPMECWTVAFSPCGTKIISGSNGGKIHVYSVETGQKEKQLDTHGKYVLSIAYVSTYTGDLFNSQHLNSKPKKLLELRKKILSTKIQYLYVSFLHQQENPQKIEHIPSGKV